MTLTDFKSTLSAPMPPAGLSAVLTALWHDARGDWDAAHRVAQDIDGPDGAWIHAYLHRKEGDLSNADYWYKRAGSTRPDCLLQVEWQSLVDSLLGQADS